MAANESVSLTFEADLSALRKELAQVPGLTKKEADQAVKQLEVAYRKAEVAAKKAATAQAKAARQGADASKKANGEAVKGLLELGDAAGFSKDTNEKLGRGVAALANPYTAAAVAVGGFALGLAAAGAAAVALVQAAQESQKALAPFRELEGFEGLPPQAQASLEAANGAMAALGTIGSRLVEVLGADLAPAVERAATIAVKLGLALIDAANAAGEGQGIFRTLADDVAVGLVRNFTRVYDILTRLGAAFGELAAAAGMEGVAAGLQGIRDSYLEFTEVAGKEGAAALLGGLSEGFDRLDASTRDYDAAAKALINTQIAVTNAQKQTTKATEDGKAAADAAAKAQKAAAAAYRESLQAQQGQQGIDALNLQVLETQAEITGTYEDQVAAINARAEAQKAAVDREVGELMKLGQGEEARRLAEIRYAQIAVQKEGEVKKARDASAEAAERDRLATIARFEDSIRGISGVVSAAAQAASAIGALTSQRANQELEAIREAREKLGEDITAAEERQLKKREQAAQRAAIRGFRISQAAAIAQAAVQGAQAVIGALTLPGPAGPIAAALVSAAIAAQVGLIASASPPKFHRGGMIGKPMGDEVIATVLPGEAVLSRQGVSSIGGEAGVRAINRGEGMGAGGGQVIVTPVLGFGRFVQSELRRPSVLARAVRGTVVSNAGRKGF